MVQETSKVVAVGERSGVVYTSGQVGNVHAGESVDGTGVTSDGEELWVLEGSGVQVGKEIWNGVFVADGALVPVVWNGFVAFGPGEAAGVAGDGEE